MTEKILGEENYMTEIKKLTHVAQRSTSEKRLLELVEYNIPTLCFAIARNPNVTEKVLLQMFGKNDNVYYRKAIILGKNVTSSVLEKFAELTSEPEILENIVENSLTPNHVLEKLLYHEKYSLRLLCLEGLKKRGVGYENFPTEWLKIIAENENSINN